MAKCKDYRKDLTCPHLYKCGEEGESIQVGTGLKKLDQYCFYCTATPGIRKIGHLASWPGSTPKWCPLGRDK